MHHTGLRIDHYLLSLESFGSRTRTIICYPCRDARMCIARKRETPLPCPCPGRPSGSSNPLRYLESDVVSFSGLLVCIYLARRTESAVVTPSELLRKTARLDSATWLFTNVCLCRFI